MSRADLDAGSRWGREIERQLSETSFGVICLTPENVNAPWVHFEAGALAKTIEDTYVVPYLMGLSSSDLPPGPLTLFQGVTASEEGTWELVKSINKGMKDRALPEDRLRTTFAKWWPDLQLSLSDLPPSQEGGKEIRPLESMVSETLELVRGLARKHQEGSVIYINEASPIDGPSLMRLLPSPFDEGEIAQKMWYLYREYNKNTSPLIKDIILRKLLLLGDLLEGDTIGGPEDAEV